MCDLTNLLTRSLLYVLSPAPKFPVFSLQREAKRWWKSLVILVFCLCLLSGSWEISRYFHGLCLDVTYFFKLDLLALSLDCPTCDDFEALLETVEDLKNKVRWLKNSDKWTNNEMDSELANGRANERTNRQSREGGRERTTERPT